MQPIPSGDEELLRQRFEETGYRGPRISGQMAEGIARWFARRAIGPGFKAYIVSGLVTPQFYCELTYLYDLRGPDIARQAERPGALQPEPADRLPGREREGGEARGYQ